MTGADAKKLAALLKKLRTKLDADALAAAAALPQEDGTDETLSHIIFALLLWEATSVQARAAYKRVREEFVDANELRTCMPADIVACIGEKYPLAEARAVRIRSVLHNIFSRHQSLSLAHVRALPKRDALSYLENITGLPHFGAARVYALSCAGGAVPVDDRLRDALVEQRIIPQQTPPEAASRWLAHEVSAGECAATHLLLQAWSDELPRAAKAAPAKPPSLRPAPKARTKSNTKASPKAAAKPAAKPTELKPAVEKAAAPSITKPAAKPPSKAPKARKSS